MTKIRGSDVPLIVTRRQNGEYIKDIAQSYGVSTTTICNLTNSWAAAHNIVFPKKVGPDADEDRDMVDKDMSERRLCRETLDSIGSDYGITRERVRQRTNRYAKKHGLRYPRGIGYYNTSTVCWCQVCGKAYKKQPSVFERKFCSMACWSDATDRKNQPRASMLIDARLSGMTWQSIANSLGESFNSFTIHAHRLCYREFRRRLMHGEPVKEGDIRKVFHWGRLYLRPLINHLRHGSELPLDPRR